MTQGDAMHEAGILRGEVFVSKDELDVRSLRAANALRSVGMSAGDTVALLLRNDLPLFEAAFGAARIGAATVPINWHGTSDEVLYVLKDCQAKLLIAHADLLQPIVDLLPPSLEVRVVTTPPDIAAAYGVSDPRCVSPAGVSEWSTWLDEFPPIELTGDPSPSTIVYTSGTTGRPKGVRRLPAEPLPEADLEAMMLAGMEASAIAPGMRTAVTGPMYHSAPNAYGLTAVALGGFVVLLPRFDPASLLDLIERHRLTHLNLVPTMFVRLLRYRNEVGTIPDTSSLQAVAHAAAPCPPEIKRQMIDWLGPIIMEYYGGTETGAVTSCTSQEWLDHPGTVGKPMPGVTVNILDQDGTVLGPGGVGEIFMRNRAIGDFTYEGMPEAREEVGRDGLVTCGDVGYFDHDGFLHLCDRKRDMVISGGVNIYPAEIEACIISCPGVRDCAVFGIPDEEFGESLCAVVEPVPGAQLTADDIKRHVALHLARFKVPKLVTFSVELPREDSGKIFKRKLREPYWAAAGRAI